MCLAFPCKNVATEEEWELTTAKSEERNNNLKNQTTSRMFLFCLHDKPS